MITINKYRVNKLIPDAVKIIKEQKFIKDEKTKSLYPENEKPKEYNGYISAFNANCIMMTPLATAIMCFYSKGSSEDKNIILKWIFNVLLKECNTFTTKTSMIDYIEENTENGKIKTAALINILTAGNALKLAIRKFKLV